MYRVGDGADQRFSLLPVAFRLAFASSCLMLLAVLVVLVAGCGTEEGQPVTDTVETAYGEVRGAEDQGMKVFLAVPFAAPPEGELRWRPPEPPAEWDDPLSADELGPMCPQIQSVEMLARMTGEAGAPMGEDCLHLNLWTPALRTTDRLPVMVWLHGGSFTSGSNRNSFYDGTELAARGVVVVVPNYRLGPLGFMVHPALRGEDEGGGNWGLQDQVMALRWVRENAEAFGGDPQNVTVFGESAGGLAIAALMASDEADGLFHRAIIQSGAAPSVLREPEEAPGGLRSGEELGLQVAERLGVAGTDDQAAAALRRLSWDEILRASEEQTDDPRGSLPSDPVGRYMVIDGTLLEEPPGQVFAGGEQAAVPMIVGTVRDEGSLFATGLGVDSVSEYERIVQSLFPDAADQVLHSYPAASDAEVVPALAALLGDLIFQREARQLARAHAGAGHPTYRYLFSRVAPAAALFGLGAFHGSEIPYVFGTTGVAAGLSPGGVEEADRRLSELVMNYWVRFAQTGDPNGEGAPHWPSYDPARDNMLLLDIEPRVEEGFRAERLDLIEGEFDEERLASE
jgi:para-nitrobenzyl esterase